MDKFDPSKVFDRQMRIQGWDQKKVSEQVALCLGTGGLGSCVSINLARLGVKKIILVDYDVVDVHNLNRQLLFTKDDIGKSKAEQGKKNLEFHNVGDTIIEAYNIDAVKNWSKIIELAKESTIVFGMIDYGEYFDVAVQALCLALKLPMIMGGTFSGSLTVDLFRPLGGPCYRCVTDGLKADLVEKLHPSKILSYDSIDFIPKDNNPIGQSNVYLCSTCSNVMTSLMINYIFDDESIRDPKRIIFYVTTFESVIFPAEREKKCPFCAEFHPEEELPKTEEPKVEEPKTEEVPKTDESKSTEAKTEGVVNAEVKVEEKTEQ